MTKIYKLIVSNGQPRRWYSLSEAKQKKLLTKVSEAFDEIGGERMLMVDSSWSSEQHPNFQVEVYPDIEAVQKYTAYLNKLNFLQYFTPTVVLGTELTSEITTPKPNKIDPDRIYKLILAKGQSPRWEQLPEEKQKLLWKEANRMFADVGGKRILWADSSWCSEEYPSFFIEIYPNIEALQNFTACLNEMRFLQYFDVMTIIGTEVAV